jgi:ribosome-associated heat shock protein Hsp15
VRLDVWLDVACLFRTRSEAQRACKGGKVEVAGVRAKPHREIRAGDRLTITRPLGRRQLVVVRGIETRHITKAEARLLYEDLTPPLSAAELEMRRLGLDRSPGRAGAPDKRERRELRRLKGREPR